MTHTIKIIEHQTEVRPKTDGQTGATKEVTIDRTIYEQRVEDLSVVDIINAVNKKPDAPAPKK